MTAILRNIDLNDGAVNQFEDWETCAASAFGVVVYTGNLVAAYSTGQTKKFHAMDLNGLPNL